jgi:hypothetical protein
VENNVLDYVESGVENAESLDLDASDLIAFLCRSLAILWKDWPAPMEATLLDAKIHKFSLSGMCPHCHARSVFNCVTNTFIREAKGGGRYEWSAGMQCPGCLRCILGLVEGRGSPPRISYQAHYPIGAPDDSVDESVPESIASDFAEAMRCLWVNSHKAAVAMCRRCVEASCHDLEAKGSNLFKRIEYLASQGIITEPLKRMAHRVRLVANEELHGKGGKKAKADTAESIQADDLDTFGEADAKAMIAFVREFFHHVYVMPALLRSYDEPEAASDGTPPASSP